MPIRPGSMPHSAARLRTILTARWASSSGPGAGTPFSSPGRRGHRYFRMMPVIPWEFSQAATSSPSRSQNRSWYPPPGQISMAVPVFFSAGGRYAVKEGRVTLVISRVLPTSSDSWMRLFSSPSMPASPGTGPGHSSMTRGSAALIGSGV